MFITATAPFLADSWMRWGMWSWTQKSTKKSKLISRIKCLNIIYSCCAKNSAPLPWLAVKSRGFTMGFEGMSALCNPEVCDVLTRKQDFTELLHNSEDTTQKKHDEDRLSFGFPSLRHDRCPFVNQGQTCQCAGWSFDQKVCGCDTHSIDLFKIHWD